MVRIFWACVLFLLVSAGIAAARQSAGPPPSGVPAPESVIGWPPCADDKLATYEQIADYFRAVDAASDRMELVEIGRTTEGRTQLLAIISSEANIKKLGRYKDISRRLALARGLSDAQARALAQEGKAIVWINFGLHSTEVAHAQTAPWMAYRVVTEDSNEMRSIRDNVIFLLLPNMNPDGTTAVANWYMKHLGTPYAHVELPELFQKYVGHDNNRDWFMFTQPETKNVGRQLYAEWFPQIVYDQHQTPQFPARIFIPPFADPMNPNIPAGVMRGINAVGTAMARRFDREGKPGVISRLDFDTWWNGGMRSAPYFHNMVGILTETQHNSPAPAFYDPEAFPPTFRSGQSTREPSLFYPNPHRGGEWHLRDSCEYIITASMAVLDIGAKRRAKWLYDIYRMGRDAIRAGEQELYVIPADQWDPGAAVKLVNVLRWGAIDVERVTTALTVGNRTYAPGSYMIRGAQPFRAHLTDLLNPQVYPDRRPRGRGLPERPYDITGWTLPFQMGVRVEKIQGRGARRWALEPNKTEGLGAGRSALEAGLEPVAWAEPPTGAIAGRAKFAYALDPRANDSFTAINRLLEAGETIYRTGEPVIVAGEQWPAGTFLVRTERATHDRIEREAQALGLRVGVLEAPADSWLWRLTAPRVGLYHGWGGNIDEGWTRWILEQFGFRYTSVYDREMRAGKLRERYDVLVLPDATYERMLNGLAPGRMPPQYTGGMTAAGVANIRSFVEEGGTLIALDTAVELPLTVLDLPVHDIARGQSAANLYIPGSLLRITIDPSHPVGYGMPEQAAAFFLHGPVFSMDRTDNAERQGARSRPTQPEAITVAQYPHDNLLMSGWLLGDRLIAGQAAVVHVRVGEGQVVLLGFRAQHRGQTHGTFKLLFNSIYLGGMERARTELHITAPANRGSAGSLETFRTSYRPGRSP